MPHPVTQQRSVKSFLVLVCLLAFAIRLAAMFAGNTYRVVEDDTNHFGFGWEMGRVAASLAEGQGFSSPLPLPTGPTAMVGPVFPLLLAGVFKLFGVYSTGSSIAIRVIQSLFSSLTCLFIFLCGRDTENDTVGKLAAVAWAFFPLNIFFTVDKVWETSLTALLITVMFWSMLRLRQSLSVSRWFSAGALLGFAALTSTSLVVLVAPFGIASIVRNRLRFLRTAAAAILACVVVVSPWLVRNHGVFGKFMMRSNFPLEFRVANNESSWGQKLEALHPSNNLAENEHWQQVGELRFMDEDRQANAEFLAHHMGRFVFVTFNRIVNYWTSAWIRTDAGNPNVWPVILPTTALTILGFLGLWRLFRTQNPAAFLYAGCLFIYPIVYCITTSQPRFYHAMTPLLILSGSFLVIDFRKRWAAARESGSAIGVAAAKFEERA
jgi:4-amino-4-deoxy-L-arabinose transferase-like glycosyltransferase